MTNLNFKSIILTLVTLLTLSVGQSWANNTSVTFYYAVDATTAGSSCNDVKYCIKYGGGDGEWTAWTSMTKQDKTQGGKLVYKATYTFPYDGYHNWQFIVGSTVYEWYAGSWNSTLHNGQIYVQGSGWTTYSPDASYTVYFVNTNNWTAANVKAYAWNNNGGSACDYNAAWSGAVMTSTGKSLGGHTIYKLDFNKRYSNIIFSNNGSSQTSDLTLGTTNAGKMYDNGTWKTYQFDITLDPQSGSGGTSSVTGVVGSGMPGSKIAPTRTGYTFGGYYTNTGGGGTCYYNASMASQQTVSASTPNTLYAKWTKKTYTVTVNNDGNGTTTPSGTQSSIAQVDGIAIDATANTNYEFVDWEIISGTGSFASAATTKSNTFYPTSAATIRANFRSTLTYSLTVAKGSYVGTVTGSTDPVTLGNSYAISASNFTSGYEFNNWTASPAANATFASSTSASTNVTVKNGSVTVTANAREIMRTITISGGTAASTTAGVATQGTATAAAPAAGKKFTGWTLGTGVSLAGGYALTDRTIKFTATQASSVTANYADRAQVKVYFAKPSSWSTAYVYAWKSDDDSKKNATWPGVSMASTETINYITYYTYQYYTEGDGIGGAATGNSAWDNIKFTDNGDDDKRTADLAISSGHYYFVSSAEGGTGKATAPTSAWCVKGAWNDWSEDTDQITHSAAATGSKSITLTTGNKEFKVYNIVEQTWWRFSGDVSATKAATTLANNIDGNMTITPSVAGPYTFTLASLTGTPTLAITYPTTYTVELEVGTVKGNKYDPKIYLGSVSVGNIISSGSKVLTGSKVIFAISNNKDDVAAAGYNWWGFYNNASGTGSDLPEKYTDDRVSTYTINSISDDAHVYAVFGEIDYWAAIYNNGNGSVSPNGANVHVATATSFTATADHGWKFVSWDQFADTFNIATPSAATTNVTIKSNKLGATGRLRANYQPRWSICGTLPTGTAWDTDQYQINDTYYESPASSGKYEGQTTIDLAANTQYELKIKDRKEGDWYGFASGTSSAGVNIVYSESGDYNSLTKTSDNLNLYLNSAAEGTYTFKWNEDNKQLAISYPASILLYLGQNNALGGSVTAEDNDDNTITNGQYAKDDATVTFTAAKNTGYNFSGWFSESDCAAEHALSAVDDSYKTIAISENVLTFTNKTYTQFKAYAKFTPKSYTVALDMQSGATGYGSGSNRNETVYYNTTLTTVGSLPTAANGYAFMGFYTATGGRGTQFINASGVWNSSVTDTIADSKWVLDAGATLYAYFKKAEITGITLSPGATVAPSTDVTPTTVTATPTVSPTPAGTTKICWKILRDNGNPITPQPTFSPGVGNAVTFPAPKVSGSYKVACVLRTGSECGAGTVLDSVVSDLVVAGEHTVTIQYQDGDGRTLKDTIHITGKPLEWTTLGDITPPTITGYTFARWEAGDGITIKNGDSDPVTTTTTSSIQIKAIYDGTLTAVYTKKDIIYFNNTLGWDHVYVYFYSSNAYWNASNGTGAYYNKEISSTKAHWYHFWGEMTQLGDGDIYYFDYQEAAKTINPTYWSEINGYTNVVFTKDPQGYGYGNDLDKDGTGDGYEWFYKTKVVRRSDFNHGLPMFVPLAEQEADVYNESNYYNDGYWMNYPENSGYTLKIYNDAYATKETAAVQSIAFPYSGDLIMPLKIDVEFTDGYNHDYWFMVYRNDGTYMGNTYQFKQGWNDEQIISGGNNKSRITTSAPGKYKFTLTYHDNGSGTVNYYIDVDFPIADGDYRIVYTDNATWSQGAHGASWNHPSDIISKAVDAKKDTVSFFVSKGDGITPAMKFQKASVTNEGVVTWSDVAGGSITIPTSITTSGVYNFIVSQPAGGASISLEKVEPYTGNFYIRTDCAGNTKWDSFKNMDHQMTYSEFAKDNSGFTHYYTHWVEKNQNVKFTIANDYSMCISDTLIGDYGTTIANIDGAGKLESDNASIRFMWDQATNKISRAYISGSSTISDRFLVLEGDSRLFDENGASYSISGLNANEVNLIDDQNFVYERIIQVQPGAQAKLTAKYNGNVQYFQGGSGSTSTDSIILLGGTKSDTKYDMRIVYDFKTNRLIRAYQPSGVIDVDIPINADMMIVREHHDAGNQLIFGNEDAKLSKVKTVYGVMRFNRWTLNNKSTADGHATLPVAEQKSSTWRGLYWISFPFDVNLSDVFGFGTYGTDWIIMYYDGARRAKEGYWADSKSFWTYIWNRRGVTLKAGEGYVLALELPNMKSDNTDFWKDGKEQIELFFPSADEVENIQQTTVDITVASHECTIDRRTDKSSGDANKDRTIADSHWNVIGVPSYANYGTTLSDGSSTITWNDDPSTDDLPFLYEWNANDNTYTAQSGSTYNFKSMHSYIVQYNGTLRWTLASATPSSIVARRTYSEAPQSVEFRLELQQDDEFIDQTFVKMSNDEEVSAAFAFGEDMTKEFNGSKSNIYTLIENYLPTAGNTLPISESITIVPVGIKIKADGDYTFAIPDGTDGVGITLVDEETGIRTNLSLLNYNVYLEAGTYNNRFYLEISPVRKTPTSLEGAQSNDIDAKVRKVLINDILYIVKDGMIFDAHGARVQ